MLTIYQRKIKVAIPFYDIPFGIFNSLYDAQLK